MKPETIRVLLIEDNPDCILFIQEMLTDGNYNKFVLECAKQLSTGLRCLSEGGFDVVLLDLSLSDSQGLDTLIKVQNFASEVPIVVLTNHDDEMFAIKAVQKGAQDYLVKGLMDSNVLVRSIRYAIERNKMLKRLEQAQMRLQHLAHHDSLTDLPNRHLFYDYLDKSVARAFRHATKIAVLFVDLDKFKYVNDTMGHPRGDLLLVHVARRLVECIRESDIIARIGGDEFVVMLDAIKSEHDAAKVAQKILEAMSKGFMMEDHEHLASTSIGISLYPTDGSDVETLIRNADSAMYTAKECGGNNYKFFLSDLNDKVLINNSQSQST
ncbi:MAG: diguanylate cyclase domain-containing protein [Planctomycetota bacterium]|jgi:diguanylate cyclase (GGDEF)-like protein